MADDSPIEQVRLTVPPMDDPTLQVLTFRTWLVGMPLCILQTVLLRIGLFRRQMISISSVCIDIILLIVGNLLAKVLPEKSVRIPGTRWSFSLNPCPFNIKEHVTTSILVNSISSPGFLNISIAKIFYHREIQFWPALFLVISTQFLGFGFAGMFLKFLVDSPYMWWPGVIPSISFYKALHEKDKRPKGELSVFQFFFLVSVAAFAYTIIPSYFFPSITGLSVVCWIWKDSITAQQIGSGFNGLAIGSLSFDWLTITSFLGDPLLFPAFVILNMLAGFIILAYIILPWSYWSNAYEARKFPLFSTNIYDSTGHNYNVSRIVDPNTLLFDSEAYSNYSKVYYSTSLIYTIGFSLALYTSTISHIALFYGRSVWHQFKKAYKDDEQDVHARLMKQNYESVPQWWFSSISLLMIGMAILVCEGFGGQIQLRYWEVLLACALVLLFLPLECALEAITGSGFTLDLLLEVIIGYLNPGKPLGNMAFKLYGSEAHQMAAAVIGNFKLSHYMKLPPKIIFFIMFISAICSCFVDFGVAWWMLHSIKNICQPDLLPEGSPWTCPSERATYISGVTWGLVGPSKIFYPHGMYSAIFIFALIGLVAPIPLWLLSHKNPEKKWITLVNFPIIFSSATAFPLGGLVGYWGWFAIGLFFNYFIFQKHKKWWARYNYVLSAGLGVGSTFCVVLLSVSLQFQDVYGVNWWGLDNDHCPLAKCPTASGVVIEGCPVIK
ncbi:oligopeptide transporter 1-like isoform X2 [Zingiber officinale]|uniref:Uncharacterized protein n=2 Tax=Zingiber officinale TaxID=94328 RepID=A0A8J5LXT7_ZINOF|nr:oligopeptide transporter 1-like isoform X2 [Zingiber officinale]XP_042455984.1 oligopeptide transporter 1-like isoform X2 [Zingiber officinale]XP_042455986.1 oligopeptide transporter 1-like isoform X2 [Zingiber officinale]XP_042455987.1 oligopeptide transporter 1-like isoform X2 [Zingiber officinale]XP_042455988.1 oligopeptide transporter 1-like isoform X2 [Zingiber officinale]XP_042455989.1 oligopeptide transporter 1-like isoform X2 [Zingiber officinale]XP_042455990.1 oligopeptide transpo